MELVSLNYTHVVALMRLQARIMKTLIGFLDSLVTLLTSASAM